MSANIWKRRLAAPQQHRWFEAFEAAPQDALDSLLRRRFDLANLGVLDVDDLLSRWVLQIGNEDEFAERVDYALSEWIDLNWGCDESVLPDSLRAVWTTVGHVLCTSYVPANQRYFDLSAGVLSAHLLQEPSFAPLLFSPRGHDAFYACANAMALYQRDDHLRSFWLQLAELPNGFPSRYAALALTGIRRMRVAHGGFRFDLGRALFIVARALSRLVRDGITSGSAALDDFSFLYERARSNFPSFDAGWAVVFQSVWQPEIRSQCCEEIIGYVDGELHRLRPLLRTPDIRDHRLRFIGRKIFAPNFSYEDVKQIERKLLNRDDDDISAAEWLLNEQRSYGLKTSDFSFLVRTLQRFSVVVRNTSQGDRDLLIAQNWVVEITERDPDDPRGWSLLVDVLKRRDELQGTTSRAWRLAWALVDRFSGDAYCRTGLAEVLKSQGRLNESEEVYRQAVEDLPHSVVARSGLAEVFKSQGRFSEAEEIYRQAIDDFPHNAFCYAGLAFIVGGNAVRMPTEAERYLAEAERHYQSALHNQPDLKTLSMTLCGLGWVCEKQGRLNDAVTWYSKVLRQDRRNVLASNRLAILKQQAEEASSPGHLEVKREIPDLMFEAEGQASQSTVSWAQYIDSEPELTEQRYQRAEDAIPGERVALQTSSREAGSEAQPVVPWSIVGYRLRMARATFFRRSARHQESLAIESRSIDPAKLRASARKLLNEVIGLRPTDSRAIAELFSLELEDERYSFDATSQERLLIAQKIPTAELLQVAASAVRIRSRREQYSLHDAALREEVFGPVQRLRSFDPAAKPLCDLGESLAAFAMVDSNERLQVAAGSLEKLRRWVSPKEKRVREALETGKKRDLEGIGVFDAWSHAITQHFFKPCGLSGDTNISISLEQVRTVDDWLQETSNQRRVADMEYQLARLLTPAIEETLALA